MQEMHITCQREQLPSLMLDLQVQFEGIDEVERLDFGTTVKRQAGFVVMQWDAGEVDAEFLKQLKQDKRVLDVSIYEIPSLDDAYPFSHVLGFLPSSGGQPC